MSLISVIRRDLPLQSTLASYIVQRGQQHSIPVARTLIAHRLNSLHLFSTISRRSQQQYQYPPNQPQTIHSYGQQQQYQQTPPKRPLPVRALLGLLKYAILFGTFAAAGAVLSAFYISRTRPDVYALLVARGKQPTDADTLSLYEPPDAAAADVDAYIRNHPIAVALRENNDFTESRPHMKLPRELRPTNLTGGTLSGPGRIAVPPLMFNEQGGKTMVSIFYLGEQLCGHPGIIHGGLLATLLDEGLARCCFPALPNKVAVTANLKIDYRKPAKAEGYFVLRAETLKVEGRKAWVKGWIERLGEEGEEPVKCVEAEALYIEPRNVAAMKKLYNMEDK